MPAIKVADEAHWLSLREAHIGGSDIASLFYEWVYPDGTIGVHHLFEQPTDPGARVINCVSSFKTGYRLWQEKAGRLKPDDFELNDHIQAGIHLEPAIAEWSRTKFGWKVRKVKRYLEHDTIPFWGASLDYELADKGAAFGSPVEIKTADGFIFKEQWQVQDDEIIMPPLPYVLQIQHQIGAVGADKGWIVVCVGGNQLYRGFMDRHEPTQKRIGEAISAFDAALKSGVEPTWLADYETVAKQYADGTSGKSVDLSGADEIEDAIREFLEAKEKVDGFEADLTTKKGRVAALITAADPLATKGVTKFFQFSWPSITREEKMLPAKLQKGLVYRGGLTIKERKN